MTRKLVKNRILVLVKKYLQAYRNINVSFILLHVNKEDATYLLLVKSDVIHLLKTNCLKGALLP